MSILPITGHMVVVNEDQFVKSAIASALPFLNRLLIYDTGSTDNTRGVIKSIKSPKILFEEKDKVDASGLTKLRNEMIAKTNTDWFFLLDGDEVWNESQLKNYLEFTLNQPKWVLATFLRTRNCVGDIYHYRDETSGHYEIAGIKGHLNIRAYRKNVRWVGDYPLEHCVDSTDKDSLAFFDGYYWHMTHLKRSSSKVPVIGFRKRVYDLGVKSNNLPEVLLKQSFPKRSKFYEIIATGAEIWRRLK